MPARTIPPLDLQTAVPHIFDQVQTTSANHQKNLVALHKLHLKAAQKTEPVLNGQKLVGEREFESVFMLLLARVLPVKKGASTADRVVKFVGGYIKFINERAADDRDEDGGNDNEDDDTTASRFTAKILKFLLKGFQAKDKFVRFRVVSLAAEMVVHLGEVDEDIYQELRTALLDRIRDKEAIVRVPVVFALSKFAGSEDTSELGEGERTVLQVLIDTLSTDPSSDVRRATMVNIPVNPITLPALISRSRDTETTIRKLLYSPVLDNAAKTSESGHPKVFTVEQRELLVRNGLGDREKSVRVAAATLIGTWVDVVGEDGSKPDGELASRLADVDLDAERAPLTTEEKQQKLIKTLAVFLTMFDLEEVSPDANGEMQSGKLASDALKSIFETQPEILKGLYFGDAFFADLSPETIFLARVFVDYCVLLDREDKGKGEQKMEGAGIPVVTSCAFRIQNGYNVLAAADEENQDGEDEDEREEARRHKEFVVGEMLKLAVNLDYSDEIGRRKMFALVRDMLTRPTLSLNLVPRCLDVLRRLSNDERDLIRVVVEIVQDLREPGDEEDDLDADASFDSERPASRKPIRAREDMSPEEQRRTDMIDMRCLSLCTGMLERVNGTLDENSTLQGILADLIIPSVKRKEAELRAQGLIALGLFCLIAKALALNSLPLFVSQAEADIPEELRLSLLQIIFDLLMSHERTILAPGGENAEKILTFLVRQLESESDKEETSPKVLTLLSTGIAKLLLGGMITDEKAIKSLMMVYLSPYNADNQELKQCLTYFVRAYSHSSAANQRVMREIFVYIFQKLSKLSKELDDDLDAPDLAQIADMWIHWTDPSEVLDPNGRPGEDGIAGDPLIQFEMANDIIRALLKDEMPKEDRKVLVQTLGKLYIPDEVDVDKIRTLKLLMHTLNLRRPLHDATSKNAFNKFDANISKKFEKQLEDFDEAEYRKLEELKELFAFLDEIIPDDDDEVINTDVKKKGKKRRSDSIMSTATDADDGSVAAPSKRGKSKPKTK
ncbi:nuclear condensing complex subunit [Mycena rosella]|uniref:Nuclear condensing complex subunit n=1 Tax=Mycena rosella TaxID=1033263 RepID=A0AAD7G8U8_MYCRO|nr:nuclear condensing complex subunit [Mycena rosella]